MKAMGYILNLTLFLVVVHVRSKCPFKKLQQDLQHSSLLEIGGGQGTLGGCECKDHCRSTRGIPPLYDWCHITDKDCEGNKAWSLFGFKVNSPWDYCTYPEEDEEQKKTAEEKLENLWTSITSDATSGEVPFVGGIVLESVQTTFYNYRDTMPEGRKKYIHSVGTVCKFRITNNDESPYTGVFKQNTTQIGLVRLGSAVKVTATSGIIPGIGVKYMRSGKLSGNYVGLIDLAPLPDKNYNFFDGTFSNHIGAPKFPLSLLAKKFNEASQCASQVGVSDLAKYDGEGQDVGDDLKFPYKLTLDSPLKHTFDKTDEIKARYLKKGKNQLDGLQESLLKVLKKDQVIFNVKAYASADDTDGVSLGDMVAAEDCVTSKFGDTKLFFRHQLIEEDWNLKPSFLDAANEDPKAICGSTDAFFQPKKLQLDPPKTIYQNTSKCDEDEGETASKLRQERISILKSAFEEVLEEEVEEVANSKETEEQPEEKKLEEVANSKEIEEQPEEEEKEDLEEEKVEEVAKLRPEPDPSAKNPDPSAVSDPPAEI